MRVVCPLASAERVGQVWRGESLWAAAARRRERERNTAGFSESLQPNLLLNCKVNSSDFWKPLRRNKYKKPRYLSFFFFALSFFLPIMLF